MPVAIRTLGVFLATVSAAAAAGGACSSNNAFSLGDHPPKPTLGIQLFSLNVRPEFPMRLMEHLRIYLAETFQARLTASHYFGEVSVLADDSTASPDFTMVGAFTHATLGANGGSLYNLLTQRAFDTPSSVNIIGGIVRAGNKEPATTFECELACCETFMRGTNIPTVPRSGIEKNEISIKAMADELQKAYSGKEPKRVRAN